MLGLYSFIYTSNLSLAPWQNAVQPSHNLAGSNIWYINLGKVAVSGNYILNDVCEFQKYDASSYAAIYGGALNPSLNISNSNIYAQIGEAKIWSANAAVLRLNTVLKL